MITFRTVFRFVITRWTRFASMTNVISLNAAIYISLFRFHRAIEIIYRQLLFCVPFNLFSWKKLAFRISSLNFYQFVAYLFDCVFMKIHFENYLFTSFVNSSRIGNYEIRQSFDDDFVHSVSFLFVFLIFCPIIEYFDVCFKCKRELSKVIAAI